MAVLAESRPVDDVTDDTVPLLRLPESRLMGWRRRDVMDALRACCAAFVLGRRALS